MNKRCPGCGVSKPLSAFGWRSPRRLGRRGECRACDATRGRTRQRAAAVLIQRHRSEFDEILSELREVPRLTE